MAIDLNRVLRRNPDSAYRIYDGQATIVLPGRAVVQVLNPVGSLVWDKIDGEQTLEQILELVLGEYDVGRDQALSDLGGFVATLEEQGMVS